MDVMDCRRRLLLMRNGVENTSPIITDYGYLLPNSNPYKKPLIVDPNGCITDYYEYPAQTYKQTMTLFGGEGPIHLFTDNAYIDYWDWTSLNEPVTRNVINAGTNKIRFGLYISMVNDAYAFFVETGQILFAGKNSIYYGHHNISELN